MKKDEGRCPLEGERVPQMGDELVTGTIFRVVGTCMRTYMSLTVEPDEASCSCRKTNASIDQGFYCTLEAGAWIRYPGVRGVV